MLYDHLFSRKKNRYEQLWLRRYGQELSHYPLQLYLAGNGRISTGWSIAREKSKFFAIEYVCSGNALLLQDDRTYVINKGEVYFLRKGARHYYTAGPAGILFKRYIAVDGVELDNILRYLNLWDKDTVKVEEPKKLENLLKEVTRLLREPHRPDLDFELSCLIYKILLTVSRKNQPPYPPVIEKALLFMHHQLHRRLSLKEMSDHLGLSTSHFRRLFSQHLHCSPLDYFITLKLNWTANLLKTTFFSIKEIANRVGYNEPLYFSAQFKKMFGVSPKAFRATHQLK